MRAENSGPTFGTLLPLARHIILSGVVKFMFCMSIWFARFSSLTVNQGRYLGDALFGVPALGTHAQDIKHRDEPANQRR